MSRLTMRLPAPVTLHLGATARTSDALLAALGPAGGWFGPLGARVVEDGDQWDVWGERPDSDHDATHLTLTLGPGADLDMISRLVRDLETLGLLTPGAADGYGVEYLAVLTDSEVHETVYADWLAPCAACKRYALDGDACPDEPTVCLDCCGDEH